MLYIYSPVIQKISSRNSAEARDGMKEIEIPHERE
jgi:hypothetical protein